MHHRVLRTHSAFFHWRRLFSEEMIALVLALTLFVVPAGAATRFVERGLFMLSTLPNATTSYTLSYGYVSPQAVGSVDMLFCMSPIPYDPCVPPAGLDVSNAILSNQGGEVGFAIHSKTANHIIIKRTPGVPTTNGLSSYVFDNVKNPTDTSKAFSIRLKSLSSTDGTGPQIDFGSVRGQVTNAIVIETQVPPMLIFCAARVVEENCTSTDGNYFTDMGQLSPDSTLVAQSQMAVGTNATAGFAITANGLPPSAGTNVIRGLATPTASVPGTNQFGINLVENTEPAVGINPEGTWANALPTPNYGTPNLYKYVPGELIASSPNVSLMKKFTVSYIINASNSLRAGQYSTTITYIASGRF